MGPTAMVVYKKLAGLIAEKNKQQYHTLVEMMPKFFTSTLCHHVSERKQIIFPPSLVPQTPIRAHADGGSGNIVYNVNSGMWRDQSDRLVCRQHYVMHQIIIIMYTGVFT